MTGKGTGTLAAIRRLLLAVLLMGLSGTAVELLLLEHYEDPWQFVPLGVIAAGVLILMWHALRPGQTSLAVLRSTMGLCIASGALGIALHFRANVEFQLEIDPELPRSELIRKVLRAKAPPALAPGVMVQLGLFGLIYSYRPISATGEDEFLHR